ncbi:hypothetical protein QBC32DRAFT_219426, partial [Pseudoneurospora amorphoporcata]
FSIVFNYKDFIKDFKEKIKEFAELFIYNAVPVIPYRPLVATSQLPYRSYLNKARFVKLCSIYPVNMFHEFKL